MPNSRRPTIGVFDSGVGGLTVLSALLKRIPDADYLYFGDTARLPYGSKSAATVAHYAVGAVRYLQEQGAELLVIACNTATALALDGLESLLVSHDNWTYAPVYGGTRGDLSTQAGLLTEVVTTEATPPGRVRLYDTTRTLDVWLGARPAGALLPLVLLVPLSPGGVVQGQEPVPFPTDDPACQHLARFTQVPPGEYLVLVEPGIADRPAPTP